MNRRNFLGTALIAAGAVVLSGNLLHVKAETVSNNSIKFFPPIETFQENGMIYRMLGSTGQKVSAIGLGGFHLSKPKMDEEAVQLIRSAIDRSITFMDNCWDYVYGVSEIRMGKALKNGYRNKVFQMSKIDGRDKKSAVK